MSMPVRFLRSRISQRAVAPSVKNALERAGVEIDRQAKVTRIKPTDGTDSRIESRLLENVRLMRLPEPELQAKIIPGRRYRFDFAWMDYKVTAEVQGGVYKVGKRCPTCGESPSGRHTRGAGYETDARKSADAQVAGWICISVTAGMIKSGEASKRIKDALIARGWKE